MRFATFFLAAAVVLLAAEPVKIESGLLSGVEDSGGQVYRGIPYAAAPVGELRWRAPRPAPAWKGVRAVEKFGPACMQAGSKEMSEDCLTLNVWTPAAKAGARLPVMVWIHGGAFRAGSGSMAVYDGGILARQGVIVATLNYPRTSSTLFLSSVSVALRAPGSCAMQGRARRVLGIDPVDIFGRDELIPGVDRR